jgi:diguanylate cyclase (GGDEF)-like protein
MITATEAHKPTAFVARLATDFTVLLSLPELAECALEALDAEVGFESCTIGLRDERDPSILTLVGASGLWRRFRGLTIPREKGQHWAVLETGRPLYVPDAGTEPWVFSLGDRMHSGIYAPLSVQGRAIGVLSAHRSEVDAFSATELEVLTAVAGYLAGACEVARLSEERRAFAATDPLTGLMNRRAFLDQTETEISLSRRTGRPFAVAMLDINGFKAVNDTLGHATGDMALIRVAEALRTCTRTHDRVVRWGGDEFVLLLPATTAAQAQQLLERVGRIAVPLRDAPGSSQLTVSWGVASWPADGDSLEILMGVADARLYDMKKSEKTARAPAMLAR